MTDLEGTRMTQPVEREAERPKSPRLPPRWFIRVAWIAHRALYRFTGHRRGLWTPTEARWGTMLLTTVGRRSGKQREAILGYYEDGPNLVTMAMNGWGAPEPKWWLNLQAQAGSDGPDEAGRARRARAGRRGRRARAPLGAVAGARR